MKRTVAPIVIAIAALAAAWSPAASVAASYEVEVCTAASTSGDGLVYPESQPGGIFLKTCAETPGKIAIGMPGSAHPDTGALRSWLLTAPQGTNLAKVSYSAPVVRSFTGTNFSLLSWLLKVEGHTIEDVRDDRLFFPGNVGKTLEPHTHTVEAGLFCIDSDPSCGLGGSLEVTVGGLKVNLEDEFIPGFSGAKFPPSVAHGDLALGIVGEDQGGGLTKVELLLDGQPQETVTDDNGGRCVAPYKALQPCKLTLPASFPLHTATLKDGQHQIQYVITDVSGLKRETAPLS
ncbi:MAG TPA: hypothetical protein VHI77_01215, partial [Solirubrobacterales bacterium]|nr:hypothetical protein [Solirubrobacterales bacterium]